ncbi:isochorismatase [Bradyrhizobium oligotrophicum S58]|uniref:Isochorismatase n=1 Tax=Bradyrhizobium oligotrophicum S58 TaxID=1245469 RepID=M4Z7F2_9BRAD|nr:cysteine hydrolase family protein [Bradyrhizobium oligotrophicum]BAM89212.1 isochorismatase [Bradyrhizobium oligotrophicum S58]
MVTLADRPNTALLVIDVQNGVLAAAYDRDKVVANIASLVERARRARVAVMWVQHHDRGLLSGSPEWELVPELVPAAGEPVVHKSYPDAFEGTELEAQLAARGIGQLVVTGAQTDQCIRSTLHGAITRGYDATLVSDAHTTEDLTSFGAPPPRQVIAHTNLYWSSHTAPGRKGGTARTAEVMFGARPS